MESTGWVDGALEALELPLQRGSDFSELFLEDRAETRVSSDGQRVVSASSTHLHGAGLYLMCGTETRYGYANDTGAAGLRALAADLAGLYAWDRPAPPSRAAAPCELELGHPNPIARDPREVPAAEKKRALQALCDEARAYSPLIVECHADYQDRVQNVAVLNSEGRLTREQRVLTTVRLFVTASDGRSTAGSWSHNTANMGFEYAEDEARRSDIVARTCGGASAGLAARAVAPEVMPVVVDSGTCIHEDCGHPLESAATGRGLSVFCGRMGEQVASPLVTIGDSGCIPGLCGTNAMSDEGEPSRDNVLIRDGVLVGNMVDRLGSRQLGLPNTGAGRRQDYRFAPASRMTNTYMARGTTPTASIIPSVSHGLYVREVGGGNVNPITGVFNFLVASGNIIENGELTYPVANINLSGQSIDALLRIAAVGDEWMPDPGSLCGASSGLVPVTAFMPRILIDGMMVG